MSIGALDTSQDATIGAQGVNNTFTEANRGQPPFMCKKQKWLLYDILQKKKKRRSRENTKKQTLQQQNTIRKFLAQLDDSEENNTKEELEEGLGRGIDEGQELK
eukprot:4689585-Ditylum_brightwellii.AAC.1